MRMKGPMWEEALAHLNHLGLRDAAERSGMNRLATSIRTLLRGSFGGDV